MNFITISRIRLVIAQTTFINITLSKCFIILRWRHNDHAGVSNHQPHGCLFNRLFRRRWKKTSKLRVTGLCPGNSPGPVNSTHKGPVTRKMFPFDDVIMTKMQLCWAINRPVLPIISLSEQKDTILNHWGRVTRICVSELTIIGPDNGSLPGRSQTITWTNVVLLLIAPLGTMEFESNIHTFRLKKYIWKRCLPHGSFLSRPQCVIHESAGPIHISSQNGHNFVCRCRYLLQRWPISGRNIGYRFLTSSSNKYPTVTPVLQQGQSFLTDLYFFTFLLLKLDYSLRTGLIALLPIHRPLRRQEISRHGITYPW